MKNISRRSFIRGMAGTAALAAAGAVLPFSAMADEAEEGLDLSNIKAVYDSDVLVVGAGSGMFGAVVTARAGLKTIVIGKSGSVLATNTNTIGGTTAAETLQCKEDGSDVTVEQIFTHLMNFAEGTVNSVLVKKSLIGAGKALDCWKELGVTEWIGADRYGVGFNSVHVFLSPNKSQCLEDEVIANGGECYYNMEAKELIMDGDAVVGVYAVDADGALHQFNAKKVLLATGGFLDNDEMMAQYYGVNQKIGKFRACINDGAGIKMAQKAGAIMDTNFAVGTLADATGYNDKNVGIQASYMTDANHALCFHNIGCMTVDKNGERFINEFMFCNEPLAYGGAISARIGYYYAIVDQKAVDAIQAEGIYNRLGRPANWSVGELLFDTPKDRLQADLDLAISEGWAWKGETVEELAANAGMANLAEEVAKWNQFCADGKDSDLYLTPEFLIPLENGPFYAIEYQTGGLSTMGGIKTDNSCRALNASEDPIPNLFVGSSDNGSAFNNPYYDVGGTCSAMCFGTCWVAGETIVKELLG